MTFPPPPVPHRIPHQELEALRLLRDDNLTKMRHPLKGRDLMMALEMENARNAREILEFMERLQR